MKRVCLSALLLALFASIAQAEEPYWLEAMKAVNSKFDGNPGYVAQFGDSITYTKAFWCAVGWDDAEKYLKGDDGLPVKAGEKRWRDVFKGYQAKGPEHANYSGWTSGQLLQAIGAVLKRENPEAAIVMIGTNDIAGGKPGPEYRKNLEQIVQKCLDAHCIPVLNTIPPRRDRMDAVEAANAVVKEVAAKFKVPLADYCGEVLKRQPGKAWDGTLMDQDGVHPSGGEVNVYTEENLKASGYALRNWANFLVLRELWCRILSKPKPFSEPVGKVEPIRAGLRCEVTADTEVSLYQDGETNEQLWNWGKAKRLKTKGYEEYGLLKFDLAKCKGMTVKRATFYISRTEQCVMNVIGMSTVSTDWAEGNGTGEPKNKKEPGVENAGGVCYAFASYPDRTWAGPGSNLKYVVFGEGGSLFGTQVTGWAKDEKAGDGPPNYYSVEVPPEVVHGMLVECDSYGMAIAEEKGQRGFQNTYRRVPDPNHFWNSRESDRPCFLIVEGEVTDKTPPAPVAEASTQPGEEAGEILLSWKCSGDDGAQGGKALGYRVYVSREELKADRLDPKCLLPRCKTYRPRNPGETQIFPVYDLEPGVEYQFAVLAYDEAGNLSAPALFKGKTREARQFALRPVAETPKGAPLSRPPLRLWACASNESVSPITGNALSEGKYREGGAAGEYRNGNAVWDGKRQTVVLSAGSNDFAAFQLVVENLGEKPLAGLTVKPSDFAPATPDAAVDRLILLSQSDLAAYQDAMRELQARDKAAADRVFADLKEFHALKRQQADDPAAFLQALEQLRTQKPEAHARWLRLLGGKGGARSGGIPAGGVEIFWTYHAKDKDGARFPDGLVPLADSVSIPEAQNKVPGQKVLALYVDIWVPHKTPRGLYSGELRVGAAGVEPFAVPVEIQVGGFELPDVPTFCSEMNSYGYPSFREGEQWEGVLNLHRLAHRNRLNVNVVPYSHSGNFTVGEMTLEVAGSGKSARIRSYANFDKCFGPLLTGRAFEKNPRRGVPVTGFYLPLYENWPVPMQGHFTFDQTARQLDLRQDFSAQYKETWTAVARDMAEHLKAKGYDQPVFHFFLNNKYQYAPEFTFWLLDEPMFRDDFLAIQMFGDLAREAFKDSVPAKVDNRIDISRIEEAHDMMNRVDLLVTSQGNLRANPRLVREQRLKYERRSPDRPLTVWMYGGTNPVGSLNVANRAWTVEAWLLGCAGLLPWDSLGPAAAWENVDSANEAVFYPALEKWDYNGCYGSLRMKSFRDGQQDAEYLNLLAKKLGATRREVQELVRPILQLKAETAFKKAEDAGTVSFAGVTPDQLERLRKTIAASLDQP
jgi:lysophospholipase L1-like esterase